MTTKDNTPSNPPSSTGQPSILFVKSNKGNALLLLNQYLFKCKKATESNKYWICIKASCAVSIRTNLNDEFLLITGDHNHVAEPDIL